MLQKNRGDFSSTTQLEARASLSERPIIHFLIIKSYEQTTVTQLDMRYTLKKKTNGKIGTVYPQPMASPLGLKRQSK